MFFEVQTKGDIYDVAEENLKRTYNIAILGKTFGVKM